MQPRTKQHLMTPEAAGLLLARAPVGVLAMTGPYAIPVHFVWADGKVYIHGSKEGEKVDRMAADANVCLTVYEMADFMVDNPKTACNIYTAYESVMVKGKVAQVADTEKKREILYAFAAKYYPPLGELSMPQPAIDATALFELTPGEITGKKV
ncbi:MAG TPA: pyridoxamine 5'-phosphate oxidase family protein [Candidatus Acidoferrum sp.]|nr:pyridoxamine 5'-phosphate oxidase family protein [Candidatus Acidoferrum sp.]